MTESSDKRRSGQRKRRERPDDVSDAIGRVEESIERLFKVVRDEVKEGLSSESARAFRSTAEGIDRTARSFERNSARRRRKRRQADDHYDEKRDTGWESFDRPRLIRSVDRKIIAGVCGGLADYWGTEPWVVRVFAIIAALFFPHLLIAAYIIAWVLLPRADDERWRRRPRRPDISSHDPIAPEFGGRYAFKKSLRTLQRAFREIDRRIRNLEEAVTDPSFGVRREFGKLDD